MTDSAWLTLLEEYREYAKKNPDILKLRPAGIGFWIFKNEETKLRSKPPYPETLFELVDGWLTKKPGVGKLSFGIDYWITKEKEKETMRTFDTGATRDDDTTKLDYEGFLSPIALRRYAKYMNAHRVQADGGLRDSDNWQKGIPITTYMKSLFRHTLDVWQIHRGQKATDNKGKVNIEDALCAVIFNAFGYLHEHLKAKEKCEFEKDCQGDVTSNTSTGKDVEALPQTPKQFFDICPGKEVLSVSCSESSDCKVCKIAIKDCPDLDKFHACMEKNRKEKAPVFHVPIEEIPESLPDVEESPKDIVKEIDTPGDPFSFQIRRLADICGNCKHSPRNCKESGNQLQDPCPGREVCP